MFWKNRPTVSDTLKGWITDSFDWADDTFGPGWKKGRQLITPSRDFFTAGSGHTPQVAQQIADDIARLLPVARIEVTPVPNLPKEYRHSYQSLSEVGGTYLHDDEAPLISYNESQMRMPMAFINTMTHELMHARLAPFIHDTPGGEEAHELSTDLHCITHGFGLFALEGPYLMGWSGYMTQESRAYATAMFLARHKIAADLALSRLSPRPAKALRKAIAEHSADEG